MATRMTSSSNLKRLTDTVEAFCIWIESLPPRSLLPREWGPWEALAHLVFWHEYYLNQTRASLAGKMVPLPAGRFSDLNALAVANFRALPPAALTRRFRAANRRLCALAGAEDPRKISFRIKQGSHLWELADLIPAAENHIRNHLRALKREFPGK
jgi:hypothetical protein